MPEMINATLSFHQDTEHNEKHDKREIKVPNADPAYEHTNIYYENNMTIGEAFQHLFEESVADFNARETHKNRRIEGGALGYLDKLLDAKQAEDQKIREMRRNGESKGKINQSKVAVKASYQFIVTVGNLQDTPEFKAIGGEKREVAISILNEYMETFQKRNPNIYLYTGAIHCDEGGMPHLHGSVIFVADNQPTGMKKKVSQTQALAQMGFFDDERGKGKKKGEYQLAITKWQNAEREHLKKLCLKRGINIVLGRGNEPHMTTKQWQAQKDIEKAEEMMNVAMAEQMAFEEEKLATLESFEIERERIATDRKEAEQRIKEKERESIQIISTVAARHNLPGDIATIYKEHGDMKKKITKKTQEELEEKEMIAALWEDFKTANSDYWRDYSEKKSELKSLIDDTKKTSADNSKRIRELMNYIANRNNFILFKLAALIAAICIKVRDNFLKKKLNALYERNDILKTTAKMVLSDSKQLSIALKSKDLDKIDFALKQWNENFIDTLNQTEYAINSIFGKEEKYAEEIAEQDRQVREKEKDKEER